MEKPITPATAKEKKGVAWYIPPALRHWLNSHAEYLSAIGEETSTDAMVVEWLKERVKIEEKKRDARKLERAVEAQDPNGVVLKSTHEDGQGTVRRSSPPDASKASTKNLRHTRKARA
jgi:hypothetical protein